MIKSAPKSLQISKIVAVRNDRLGGRLGAILNAKRISEDYGVGFSFTWSDHADVSPELQNPTDLFSSDFIKKYREEHRSYGDLQKNLTAVETIRSALSQDSFTEELASGNDFRCSEALKAVIFPWESSTIISRRVSEILDNIDFSDPVKNAIIYIKKKLKGENLVAYHLRRGDIIDPASRPSNTLWPSKYMPRVFYEEHISKTLDEDPNCKIIIFSDADHELSAFSKISDRIVRADSLISSLSLKPLQRDFLELYAMSLCKKIVAPGASAFSAVAALLGDCEIKNVKSDLSDNECNHALYKLTVRMDENPEEFAGDADLGQNFPELIEYHQKLGTSNVAMSILEKHFLRGFNYSYIYDLLAEQYFYDENTHGSLELIKALQNRPIWTDLGNSQTYAWAGLTAFLAGDFDQAGKLAQIANWFQPNLPFTRILIGLITAQSEFSENNHYPVSPIFILNTRPGGVKIQRIKEKIHGSRIKTDLSSNLKIIPFELEIRDWHILQSKKLPASFWNIPAQQKTIGFFQSTYRQSIDDPKVSSLLGQMYCQANQSDIGEKMIERAAEVASEDAFTQIRLARLRMKQSEYKIAQALYEKAASLSDNQICFQAEQGMVQLQLGKKPTALNTFTTLNSVPHNMIEIMILTADVLRRHKKTIDEALVVAQRADALAPGGLRTTQILRKILEQMGRKSEAEAILQKMISWKRKPGKFSSRINRLV